MGGIGAGGATGANVDLTTGGNTTQNGGSNTSGTNAAGLGVGTTPSYAGVDDGLGQGSGYGAAPAGGLAGGATPTGADVYASSTTGGSATGGSLGGGSLGGGAGSGSLGGDAGGRNTFRDQAQGLKSQAIDRVRSAADDGKTQIANTLDGLVEAARDLAGRLQGGQYGPVGGYAQQAADALDGWARTVREKPVDDWFDDGRELVRRSPVLAAGIAVTAGFVLSRFLKAGGSGAARYSA